MKRLLAAAMAVMLLLCGCSSNDKETNKPTQDKTEEKKELSAEEIKTKLYEIDNWYVGDVWNRGICDLNWYVKNGTSSTGGELDVEMTLKQYKDAIKKLEEYNTFVSGLTDETYADIKFAWDKLYTAIKETDGIIQANEMTANSGIDLKTDLLQQYAHAFSDYIYKLPS